MIKYEVGKHFTKGKHWIGLAFVVNTKKADDENYFLNLQETVDLLNNLHEENEQLRQQNKVYESFLDENDLEIDWSYLCIQEECKYTAEEIDSNEILCKDCKYLKTVFGE